MKYHTNNKILLLCEQTKRGIKKVEVSEEEVKLFIEEYFSQSIKPKEQTRLRNYYHQIEKDLY